MGLSQQIEILDSWKWPRLDGPQDNDALERAIARARTMFQDRAPFVEEIAKRNGEKMLTIANVGYLMIWKPEYRLADPQRKVLKIGRHPKWNDDLRACMFVVGELDVSEQHYYLVDLDNQRCQRGDGCPCPAYEQSRRRWCKHLLGGAMALTRPIAYGPHGVARFLDQETP